MFSDYTKEQTRKETINSALDDPRNTTSRRAEIK